MSIPLKLTCSVICFVTLFVISTGCQKEDITPAVKTSFSFKTVIGEEDIPDGIGYNQRNIIDAVLLPNGKLLAIIDYVAYSIVDGIYEQVLPSTVYAIEQTIDGTIYILGKDALYTSTNEGVSFTVQTQFISQNGIGFFNGYPNHMITRKSGNGTFILWIYNQFTYNLGGTGFSKPSYENFVFISTDGAEWEFLPYGGSSFANDFASAIDMDGVLYFDDLRTDGQTYTIHDLYTSGDYGETKELVEMDAIIPTAVSNKNQIYSISSVYPNGENMYFKAWDGSTWKNVEATFTNLTKGAIVHKTQFTEDDHMLLVTSEGIFLSE